MRVDGDREWVITPEKIAAQLRIDIIGNRFEAEESITETAIAKRFEASRSSVRVALQELAREGLIETLGNGRRKVIPFTEKEVCDLYDFRWLIEEAALERILTNKVPSTLPEVAKVLGGVENALDKNETILDLLQVDISFHRALVRASQSPFIQVAWEGNANLIYALMSFNASTDYKNMYYEGFYDTHRKLYEKIICASDDCFDELKKHIYDGQNTACEIIRKITESKNK